MADWAPWQAQAAALLDPPEIARVRRRRLAADRDMLTFAYAAHRLLLGRMLSCDPLDVPLRRDPRGCPRVGAGGICTSLSHADGVIALAVTRAGPVGVDVESPDRAAELPEIADRVCHAGEKALLRGLDEPARALALLGMWVRKEAVLKAAGVGLAVEMDTFAAPSGALVSSSTLGPHPIQVRMLEAGAACMAALAGPRDLAIDCRWLRPRVDASGGWK
ncbi:4'-phosphopantetheinyl transferase superfamily protein [Lysobacter sp. D1-1-M9]